MNIFGMFSSASSKHYTPHGVKSLLATTSAKDGRILVIDNDACLEDDPAFQNQRVTLERNDAPKSFAANVNRVLSLAREEGADAFILNNDIIFTEGWLAPVMEGGTSILCPASNAQFPYQSPELVCKPVMDLEDYLGKEAALAQIVSFHRSKNHGLKRVHTLAYFCVRIPAAVYLSVGDFDEAFSPCGGEDGDYSIRTYLAGFDVQYAADSFVLHFQGKTTWRGGESELETQARNNAYIQTFRAKWGDELTRLFIMHDKEAFARNPGFQEAASPEVVREVISNLIPKRES